MPSLVNGKGQPVKMSFLDLFVPGTPSHSGARKERNKPKTEVSSPSTETSPQSAAATEAPTEPTNTTDSGPAKWSRIEELALLGMKAQDMSWKEIDEGLPDKDIEEIKKKYGELYVEAPANVKSKEVDAKKEEEKEGKVDQAKLDEAKATNESSEKSESKKDGKGAKPWKNYHKGYKVQKGKGKAKEEKLEEPKPDEDKSEAKVEEIKGILKAKAAVSEKGKGGELKSINGHPVIFVDDEEELEFGELLYLYGLNARYDEQKWIMVDSKFFDRFGKRVGPEKLKEKLAGIS